MTRIMHITLYACIAEKKTRRKILMRNKMVNSFEGLNFKSYNNNLKNKLNESPTFRIYILLFTFIFAFALHVFAFFTLLIIAHCFSELIIIWSAPALENL